MESFALIFSLGPGILLVMGWRYVKKQQTTRHWNAATAKQYKGILFIVVGLMLLIGLIIVNIVPMKESAIVVLLAGFVIGLLVGWFLDKENLEKISKKLKKPKTVVAIFLLVVAAIGGITGSEPAIGLAIIGGIIYYISLNYKK